MIPPYPRIPHIAPDVRASRDDLVLDDPGRRALFSGAVHVEEKLDGANVALWLEDGVVQAATRGGPDAIDRAGQRGRLRAWVAERSDALVPLLARDTVLYAEWLLLTHTVRYDALPAYLIGLDLWHPKDGFASVAHRDEQLAAAGIHGPPEIFTGAIESVDALDELIGGSRVGAVQAEGVIVRAVDLPATIGSAPGIQALPDRPPVAKRLARGFVRRDDVSWRGEPRLNRLARPGHTAS